MPNVFSYTNYRRFLDDFYREKKAFNKSYSYRVFNELAGIKSPSFFKLVVAGKRNLSTRGLNSFIKALKLTAREAQFFRALVGFNQAATLEERNRHYRQMAFFQEYAAVQALASHQYQFYSRWHHVAIHEMTKMHGFLDDPCWIAERLFPTISEEEARESLQLLKKLGLIKKNERLKLVAVDKNITTDTEVHDVSVAAFQSEMIRRADECLWNTPGDDRDISSVTIALDEASFREAKRRIQEFRRELNVLLSATPKPDRVYQINFQLFNLTRIPGGGK
jgi:uncharacterized protein (TIGR02147 family)